MGPLEGLKVIEIAGIGPGPFAGMMLADMNADVLRIDRLPQALAHDDVPMVGEVLNRGRPSVGIDLKSPKGVEAVLRLVDRADALIEGFRPGVMERLGLGPDVCMARQPRLVYGRVTGWGQEGPLAHAAGHDINYIALAGALHPIGRSGEPPVPPLNLVGDFGGGGLLLAFGILCALVERSRSGLGQVVDAAMVDGAALLSAMIHGMRAMGSWTDERGANLLDTGAPFYEVYETKDGKYISIGSIEPRFYLQLLERTGLATQSLPNRMDRDQWPALKQRLQTVFKTKSRDEWCAIMEGSDVCFAPVLTLGEAPQHPHLKQRGTFIDVAGVTQPAPAPRLNRTPPAVRRPAGRPGQDTDATLASWGLSAAEITALRESNVVV
jgi:alpha-methylacyl-CoA racemase